MTVTAKKSGTDLDLDIRGEIGWKFNANDLSNILASKDGYDKVNVRINSPGGDAWAGVEIYNTLVQLEQEVETKVMALAASAASIIAMAGDKVSIAESGAIMIHQPFTMAYGNAGEMREVAEMLDLISDAMVKVYSDRTGNTESRIKEWMNAETYFYGNDAVKNNFADEVFENKKRKAHAKAQAARLWLKENSVIK